MERGADDGGRRESDRLKNSKRLVFGTWRARKRRGELLVSRGLWKHSERHGGALSRSSYRLRNGRKRPRLRWRLVSRGSAPATVQRDGKVRGKRGSSGRSRGARRISDRIDFLIRDCSAMVWNRAVTVFFDRVRSYKWTLYVFRIKSSRRRRYRSNVNARDD